MERDVFNVVTLGNLITFTLREAGDGVERFSYGTVSLAAVVNLGGNDWTNEDVLAALDAA
jgi:hypothetical protein